MVIFVSLPWESGTGVGRLAHLDPKQKVPLRALLRFNDVTSCHFTQEVV